MSPSRAKENAMRLAIAVVATLIASSLIDDAKADPYRWCAEYGGGGRGGGTNCYFMTIDQCRAAISGNGGFCRPNNFYTGSDRPRRRSSRSYY
jgi:hypothetical protein